MKKGVALLWVLVLSTVLMIITGTMVNYIIKESRFSVSIEDSIKAYAAARSGIDWGTRELKDEAGLDRTSIIIEPGVTANVVIDRPNGLITSEGQSGEVKRKLEYRSSANLGAKITPSAKDSTAIGPFSESFTLQFDFWKPAPALGSADIVFGVDSTTGSSKIGMYIKSTTPGNGLYLRVVDGAGVIRDIPIKGSSGNLITWCPGTDPYRCRATIKYIKSTSAVLMLRERIVSGDQVSYPCRGIASIDLTSYNIGTFDSLLVSGATSSYTPIGTTPPSPMDTYWGDGEFLDISSVRFDNIVFKGAVGAPAAANKVYLNYGTAGTGTGHITTTPATTCGDLGCEYNKETVVTLTASPNAGSQFTGWSGGGCSGTGTCTVILSNNVNVIATFASTTPLSLTANLDATVATLTITAGGSGSSRSYTVDQSIDSGATWSAFSSGNISAGQTVTIYVPYYINGVTSHQDSYWYPKIRVNEVPITFPAWCTSDGDYGMGYLIYDTEPGFDSKPTSYSMCI